MDVRDLIQSISTNLNQYAQLFEQIEQIEAFSSPGQTVNRLKQRLQSISFVQDEVIEFRLKKILQEEHPYIPQINPNKLHANMAGALQDTRQVIAFFLNQRRVLTGLLNSISMDDWLRTGVHECEGHVTFKELIRRMAEKDHKTILDLKEIVSEMTVNNVAG